MPELCFAKGLSFEEFAPGHRLAQNIFDIRGRRAGGGIFLTPTHALHAPPDAPTRLTPRRKLSFSDASNGRLIIANITQRYRCISNNNTSRDTLGMSAGAISRRQARLFHMGSRATGPLARPLVAITMPTGILYAQHKLPSCTPVSPGQFHRRR